VLFVFGYLVADAWNNNPLILSVRGVDQAAVASDLGADKADLVGAPRDAVPVVGVASDGYRKPVAIEPVLGPTEIDRLISDGAILRLMNVVSTGRRLFYVVIVEQDGSAVATYTEADFKQLGYKATHHRYGVLLQGGRDEIVIRYATAQIGAGENKRGRFL